MARGREREDFSKRLRQAMQQRGVEPGATRLAREFNLRFPASRVTVQAAQKWLGAEAIPAQDKLRALAAWLEVGTEWLRFGTPQAPAALEPQAKPYRIVLSEAELLKRYRRLSDRHQAVVAEIIVALTSGD